MSTSKTRGVLLTALVLFFTAFSVHVSAGTTTRATYAGYLVFDTKTATIWYAEPVTGFRFNVTKSATLRKIASRVAYPVTADQLAQLPTVDSTDIGDLTQRQRYSGRVVISTDVLGTYWYIVPSTKLRLNLSSITDMTATAKAYGRRADPNFWKYWGTDPGVQSGVRMVSSIRGTFSIAYVKANLVNPGVRLMTDSVSPGLGSCGCQCNPESMCGADYRALCPKVCAVRSFRQFVQLRSALAAINGAYFHDSNYSLWSGIGSDLSAQNSFSPKQELTRDPWYSKLEHPIVVDTSNRVMVDVPNAGCVNKDAVFVQLSKGLIFTVFTDCIKSAVRQRSLQVGGTGSMQALISTDSFLVLNRKNVIKNYPLDAKQKTSRTTRDFFGLKGRTVYFVVVRGATMYDAAAVAVAMKFDMAANLDGGGSSALYANGKYLVGPGRSIPNALLLTH